MIKAIRKRHNSIFKFFENRNLIFKTDIIYSLAIFPLILILYNYKGVDGISFAYLSSAIISFILYSKNYGKLFINKLRYFTLFLCLIFSIYSMNFYEGSKILFVLYNLTLILLSLFLTNISSSFFSFFLGFYLFMGFWFKYNLV